MKKFQNKKTGEIITYENGVIKSKNIEIIDEPNKEYWEEIKEFPIGTKVLDTYSGNSYYEYTKKEDRKWSLGTQNYFNIDEESIGEGKRFQIIEEKDFEILSFKNDIDIFTKQSNGIFKHQWNSLDDGFERGWRTEKHILEVATLCEIYSVKNLKTNEIYSLDNKVVYQNDVYTIKKILLINGKIKFELIGMYVLLNFEDIRKSKIFITEDGFEILEGLDCFYFNKETNVITKSVFNSKIKDIYFSDYDNALEYTFINIKKLSLQDICELEFKERGDNTFKESPIYKRILEFIKTKESVRYK